MEDNSGSNERLQAFCSITFDDMFVIRDLKIIEGAKGFFVAMPSRKLTDRCHNYGTKNHLRSRFCNQCGCRLDENRPLRDADGRAKLHADIAHPINSMCREKIQSAVLASSLTSWNGPRCQATSRGMTSTKSTTSRFLTTATPPRRTRPASPPSVAARCGNTPGTARQPVGASWTAHSASAGQPGTGNRLGLSPSRRVHVVRQWHLNPALRTEKARAVD